MNAAAKGKKQLFNEINITPLTDIFLVLLIIMMVVAPMMQQVRQDIKPPSLKNGDTVEQNKLTIEITGDGAIFVQGKETKPESLAKTLTEQEASLASKTGGNEASSATADAGASKEEKSLIIRADKSTKSGQVLKVFDAARDAGFAKVVVAGESLDDARQNELQQQGSAPENSDAQSPSNEAMEAN